MGIAYHQLHATESPSHQPAQKGHPERAIFARSHIKAQDFALARRRVEANRDHHRLARYPAVYACFDVGGVQPEIRIACLTQRAGAKALNLCVQLLTEQ